MSTEPSAVPSSPQTAQAMRDARLLGVAQTCQPETLRQLRWANAKVKETTAQIMVTG